MDEEIVRDEIGINAKASSKSYIDHDDDSEQYSSRGSSSFIFKRRKKIFTPEKRKELEELYQTVIVHDYGDEYHMSEEERKRKFKYYEVFSRILRCKRKYKKLDEFVKVCRLCVKCLDVVAEDNGVYDPEKFKLLVMKGEIDVYGLNFPKYVGKDRKSINWEYVSEYILNENLDPAELVRDRPDKDAGMSDDPNILFSQKEWEAICNSIDNPAQCTKSDEPNGDDEEKDYPSISKGKQSKKLIKMQPYILTRIKELKKSERQRIQRDGVMNTMVYEMTKDDFAEIASIDRKRGYVSDSDIPEFVGDVMNHEDYVKYMHRVREYENTQVKVNYQGKMRTPAEIKEIQLKESLEAAGWNVRKMYRQNDKIRNMKKRIKKDKKREEELKQMLIDIQNRQKKRGKGKKDKMEFNAKSKKSKKKKDDG